MLPKRLTNYNSGMWKALASKHPVIDASSPVLAVHQNHDYSYHPQGKVCVFHGAEALRNYQLAGGWRNLRTIADASEVLANGGLQPNRLRPWTTAKRYARQAMRTLLHGGIERAWFFFLGLTRPARRKLGIDAESLRHLRRSALLFFGRRL